MCVRTQSRPIRQSTIGFFCCCCCCLCFSIEMMMVYPQFLHFLFYRATAYTYTYTETLYHKCRCYLFAEREPAEYIYLSQARRHNSFVYTQIRTHSQSLSLEFGLLFCCQIHSHALYWRVLCPFCTAAAATCFHWCSVTSFATTTLCVCTAVTLPLLRIRGEKNLLFNSHHVCTTCTHSLLLAVVAAWIYVDERINETGGCTC